MPQNELDSFAGLNMCSVPQLHLFSSLESFANHGFYPYTETGIMTPAGCVL